MPLVDDGAVSSRRMKVQRAIWQSEAAKLCARAKIRVLKTGVGAEILVTSQECFRNTLRRGGA